MIFQGLRGSLYTWGPKSILLTFSFNPWSKHNVSVYILSAKIVAAGHTCLLRTETIRRTSVIRSVQFRASPSSKG